MTFPVFLALGSQESSPIETNDILKPADDGEQEQWAMIHTPKPYGFQDIVVDSEDDLQLAITVSNVNQTTTAFAMTTEIENK